MSSKKCNLIDLNEYEIMTTLGTGYFIQDHLVEYGYVRIEKTQSILH